MTNAVDSLNVENNVERSRCATALASHAGIPEPLVLRFEECGGTLRPDRSLWREEYQGEPVHDQKSTRAEAPSRLQPSHEVLPRADARSFVSAPEALLGPYSGALGSPQHSLDLVSASPDTYRGVLWLAGVGSTGEHNSLGQCSSRGVVA